MLRITAEPLYVCKLLFSGTHNLWFWSTTDLSDKCGVQITMLLFALQQNSKKGITMVLIVTAITLNGQMRLFTSHLSEVFGLHGVPWCSSNGWQVGRFFNSCLGLVTCTFWLQCCCCYPQFVFCAFSCSSKWHFVFLCISMRDRFHFMFVTIKPALHHDMFKCMSINICMRENSMHFCYSYLVCCLTRRADEQCVNILTRSK